MVYLEFIISCIFDVNNIIFSYSLIVPCKDKDQDTDGDKFGDYCLWYSIGLNANECGDYDDDDFTPNTMCCACKGGQSTTEQFGKYNENEI